MSSSDKPGYDVFLSYSSKDRPWVSEFVAALKDAEVRAWFDVHDVALGDDWQDRIQEALRESRTLVVILSPNSVDSPWTFFELGAAVADEKRIVPVLIEDMDVTRIPLPLRRFQYLSEPSASEAGRRVAEVIEKTSSAEAQH